MEIRKIRLDAVFEKPRWSKMTSGWHRVALVGKHSTDAKRSLDRSWRHIPACFCSPSDGPGKQQTRACLFELSHELSVFSLQTITPSANRSLLCSTGLQRVSLWTLLFCSSSISTTAFKSSLALAALPLIPPLKLISKFLECNQSTPLPPTSTTSVAHSYAASSHQLIDISSWTQRYVISSVPVQTSRVLSSFNSHLDDRDIFLDIVCRDTWT